MGFFLSYFLSLLSFHTHTKKVYHIIPCCLFRFGKKKSHFYLNYLKERIETIDEGAINLERQTHLNEI